MSRFLLAGSIIFLSYLLIEGWHIRRLRRKLRCVIHVNGTRGKTAVTRLITTVLRSQGISVLCKTTGTTPRVVHVDGQETELFRRGPVNIKEQVSVLRLAVKEKAEILVVECMAVRPEYQRVSERAILKADIGIITNVKLDHLEEMGDSLPLIAHSLTAMMPKQGICITAECSQAEVIEKQANARGSRMVQVVPNNDYSAIDHSENVAITLAACSVLGISEQESLMALKNYTKDGYAQRTWTLPGGAQFCGLFSSNDPASTMAAIRNAQSLGGWQSNQTVLIVNGRKDRPQRTQQMMEVLKNTAPKEVWLAGGIPIIINRQISRLGIPVHRLTNIQQAMQMMKTPHLYCGIGNLQGFGKALMDLMDTKGGPNCTAR